ncbi:hypothetical protein MTR67_035253 [Solanum verrucosum]|uniref:Uncharacterized protein n=1 Tax=Solanum verrucosum TaxID=315347 RepID=A0AAF0ZLB3_SOLVR|nr:hypothetical protein MTR67_035253 [Solanum verrucosum]
MVLFYRELILSLSPSSTASSSFKKQKISRTLPHEYDSMMGGDLHKRNVEKTVDKLATIISLFLASTRFYGKRLDLYSNKLPAYIDKSQSKLKVVFIKNVPQQDPSSKYVFLFYCVLFIISNSLFFLIFFFNVISAIVDCTHVASLNILAMKFLI